LQQKQERRAARGFGERREKLTRENGGAEQSGGKFAAIHGHERKTLRRD
jgi:hypothetical protein